MVNKIVENVRSPLEYKFAFAFFSSSEARCLIKLHTCLMAPTTDLEARNKSHQHRLVKQLPDCCVSFFYNPGKFTIVCYTTLLTVQISIIEKLDDYELGAIWKQAVTAYFKVQSHSDWKKPRHISAREATLETSHTPMQEY
jgi:hypothetical protein